MRKCPECGAGVFSEDDEVITYNCGAMYHPFGAMLAPCDEDE